MCMRENKISLSHASVKLERLTGHLSGDIEQRFKSTSSEKRSGLGMN